MSSLFLYFMIIILSLLYFICIGIILEINGQFRPGTFWYWDETYLFCERLWSVKFLIHCRIFRFIENHYIYSRIFCFVDRKVTFWFVDRWNFDSEYFDPRWTFGLTVDFWSQHFTLPIFENLRKLTKRDSGKHRHSSVWPLLLKIKGQYITKYLISCKFQLKDIFV